MTKRSPQPNSGYEFRFGERLTRQASFATAQQILNEIHWESVDGVILDLGISSHQVRRCGKRFQLSF